MTKENKNYCLLFDQVYQKTQHSENILTRRNQTVQDPPNLQEGWILIQRDRSRKVHPLFEPITVTNLAELRDDLRNLDDIPVHLNPVLRWVHTGSIVFILTVLFFVS